MHRHIEFLKNGEARFCEGHGDIFDAKYFPFKNSDLCVYCYEDEHSRTLHTFRKKLGIQGTRTKRKQTTRKKKNFKREADIETIKAYLHKQEETNSPISFYYREDISPRKFYNYFIDDKYVQVWSNKGYYIKFLIERIRKL